MNDRIRELVEVAFNDANYPTDQQYRIIPNTAFCEKFAELLIRECVNILEKPEYVMTHPEELTDYNRGWVNGRLLGIEHIKEQFGVES